jgi:hypothetical protein
MEQESVIEPFSGIATRHCYVGYVDILGFSDVVMRDFDRAKYIYEEILKDVALVPAGGWQIHPVDVEISALSDTFVLVSDSLQEVANWSSSVLIGAMRQLMLVRGSIAYGKHVQQNAHMSGKSRHHVLVVSEALVRAATDERDRKTPPCGITLHESIPSDAIATLDADARSYTASQRAILFRDGRWITNPFDPASIHWAEPVLRRMLDDHRGSVHELKYQWLLDLLIDIKQNKALAQ